MCTRLDAFPHGRIRERRMCECVRARVRRGLDVTPAVGVNRVSGRALQPAAAARCHYKPNSPQRIKASRTTTESLNFTDKTHSALYHHPLSLQLLSPSIAIAPLAQGHDLNRRGRKLEIDLQF